MDPVPMDPVPMGSILMDEGAVRRMVVAPRILGDDHVVTDYGGGSGDWSDALARAISECSAAGGGRVVVPAGRFRTGPVRLLSNVDLHLAEGATLEFDPDPRIHPTVLTRWQGIECHSYAPLIYALDAENVAITGHGTLDGGADRRHWWNWTGRHPGNAANDWQRLLEMVAGNVPVEERVFGPGHRFRPSFVQPYRCRNVLVAGIRLVNAPMWVVHPVLSQNVTIHGVTVDSHGPNNDGCNPDSCSGVLITGCSFDTGDDCIAIKSGRDADGRRVGVPCEYVLIENCTFADGHGGVTIGSELSGGVRHVYAANLRMAGPSLNHALRFKANSHRGGVVEDIHLRDTSVESVREAAVTIDLRHADDAVTGNHHPTVRGVTVTRLRVGSAGRALRLRGSRWSPINALSISDSTVDRVAEADIIEYVDGLSLHNVIVDGAGLDGSHGR
jgi:polygalacturonase